MARGTYGLLVKTDGRLKVKIDQRMRKAVDQRLVDEAGVERELFPLRYAGKPADAEAVKRILAEEYPDWTCEERDERPRFRRKGDRVAWAVISSEGLTGGTVGFVGGQRLFKLSSNFTRRDGTVHYLYTELPNFKIRRLDGSGGYAATGSSKEEMQDAAEEILREFLRRIGAGFIDEGEG